jgi:hypothetical protein
VGNHFSEAMSFTSAIEDFIRDNQIETVGGLYPLVRAKATGAVGAHE